MKNIIRTWRKCYLQRNGVELGLTPYFATSIKRYYPGILYIFTEDYKKGNIFIEKGSIRPIATWEGYEYVWDDKNRLFMTYTSYSCQYGYVL